jgi:hypothetical protein
LPIVRTTTSWESARVLSAGTVGSSDHADQIPGMPRTVDLKEYWKVHETDPALSSDVDTAPPATHAATVAFAFTGLRAFVGAAGSLHRVVPSLEMHDVNVHGPGPVRGDPAETAPPPDT